MNDRRQMTHNPELSCKYCDYKTPLFQKPSSRNPRIRLHNQDGSDRHISGWDALRTHFRKSHTAEFNAIREWIDADTMWKFEHCNRVRLEERSLEYRLGGYSVTEYVRLPTYNDLVSEPDDYRESQDYESSESLTDHGYAVSEDMKGYYK